MDVAGSQTLTEYMINDASLLNAKSETWKQMLIDSLLIGLKTVHQQGIAHADLKPNNIMVDENTGRAKFIDFGNGCGTDDCVDSFGTITYASPEMIALHYIEYQDMKFPIPSHIQEAAARIGAVVTKKNPIGDFFSPKLCLGTLDIKARTTIGFVFNWRDSHRNIIDR
jgi:serine/threonine protein kinase